MQLSNSINKNVMFFLDFVFFSHDMPTLESNQINVRLVHSQAGFTSEIAFVVKLVVDLNQVVFVFL